MELMRTWAAVHVAVAALVLSGGGAAATAKQPAQQGNTTNVARTIAGRAVDSQAAHDAVAAYWTPERMRAAVPADTPAAGVHRHEPGKPDGPAGSIEAAAPAVKADDAGIQLNDSQTVGKVFFFDPSAGTNKVCSASAVNSAKKRLVMTVAHCVHGGPGKQWMTNWAYAPRYRNGQNPTYGLWTAYQLTARTAWINSANYDEDMGIAIMNLRNGQKIVNVTGGNGMRWNWGYTVTVTDLAYPCNAPFNCEIQYYCYGTTKYAGHGQQVELYCDFKGGASGGPWLQEYNDQNGLGYINSLDSHDHGVPHADNGPYFDNDIKSLFDYAEGLSPA